MKLYRIKGLLQILINSLLFRL